MTDEGRRNISLAKIKDLSGNKYGKLTVIERIEEKLDGKSTSWLCQCDCGNTRKAIGYLLKRGTTLSCGCTKAGRRPNLLENREKAILTCIFGSTVKKRQKNKKWENLLSFDTFCKLSLSPCYYCGIVGCSSFKDRSTELIVKFNGIDRIDNNIGYTEENSVSCCKYCNTAKLDRTEQEFLNMIKRIYNNRIKRKRKNA